MTRLTLRALCWLIVANMAGCSNEPSPEGKPEKPPGIATQAEALSKAKQVGQVLEESARQEREEIKQQSQ
ncbi:hypothetical protein [Methylovulum miyakonense]|uniref:hypothetical protein n=1 Tax=Methylovulum miyakonense TaxID=645578 RepID=UPI0012EB1924|nr:hypothetical protein [Methylovulum miyakonense]